MVEISGTEKEKMGQTALGKIIMNTAWKLIFPSCSLHQLLFLIFFQFFFILVSKTRTHRVSVSDCTTYLCLMSNEIYYTLSRWFPTWGAGPIRVTRVLQGEVPNFSSYSSLESVTELTALNLKHHQNKSPVFNV